jgi:SNF2 family DNA or RNA helicase
MQEDESVVIFSRFTSHLKLIQELIPQAILLSGDVSSPEKRKKLVDDFNEKKFRILLSNIDVGSVG